MRGGWPRGSACARTRRGGWPEGSACARMIASAQHHTTLSPLHRLTSPCVHCVPRVALRARRVFNVGVRSLQVWDAHTEAHHRDADPNIVKLTHGSFSLIDLCSYSTYSLVPTPAGVRQQSLQRQLERQQANECSAPTRSLGSSFAVSRSAAAVILRATVGSSYCPLRAG